MSTFLLSQQLHIKFVIFSSRFDLNYGLSYVYFQGLFYRQVM